MNDKERKEAIDELADVCYECSGYGDDWYINDDGELESACSDCWVQARRRMKIRKELSTKKKEKENE